MPVSATTLKKLIDAGLRGDALVDVVASIDADNSAKPRSSAAERQARYRERNKSDVTRDVTPPSNKENPPTPPKEINSPKENPPKGGQKKRGTRLSDDFEPDREFAADQGLSPSQITTELEKFHDYWRSKPGQGGVKLDWQATWRNWCRNANDRQPRGSPAARQTTTDVLNQWAETANDERTYSETDSDHTGGFPRLEHVRQ